MSPDKLICPECGGVIGSTDPNDTPCTCATRAHAPDDADFRQAAATQVADEPDKPDESDDSRAAKVCRICGKDVSGARRYKDSLGYWCFECHRADAAARTAGKARCSNCSRLFPSGKLIELDGDRLCITCNRRRLAEQRRILRKAAAGRLHKLHERKQLLVLLAIFVILLIIILLQRIGVI